MTAALQIQGKVVLITGAGRGVGRRLALELSRSGAIVAVNDITPINIDPLVSEIKQEGGLCKAYIHDVAKKVDLQSMVINVVQDFGAIDILINSANVNLSSDLLEIDEWDLHRIFEVNSIGTLLAIQSVGRQMKQQGHGLIINTALMTASSAISTIASRSGINNLQAKLAEELNPFNVQVYTTTSTDPFTEIISLFNQSGQK